VEPEAGKAADQAETVPEGQVELQMQEQEPPLAQQGQRERAVEKATKQATDL
jgi:hypothetical protein